MPTRFVDFSKHAWRRPTQPYKVAVLSDIHFGNAKLRDRQIQALKEVDRLLPAYLVLLGDNVETARPEHYDVAQELLKDVQTPILATTGNHEIFPHHEPVDQCLAKFNEVYSVEQVYSHRVLPPYHFIFLGIEERDEALPHTTRDTGMSRKQLQWFKDRLAEHPELPTVVFSHAPLVGTVENSEYFHMAQSAELLAILDDSPNICLWLSGHTHLPDRHEARQLRTIVSDAKGHTFVHVPPVADYYVHLVHGQRRYFHQETMHTRLLTCHPDHITIHTVDLFTGHTWEMGHVVPGKGLIAA